MRNNSKQALLIITLISVHSLLFGQPVQGPSTGLCPLVAYTYTSDAGCDANKWSCSGCTTNSTDNNGAVANFGTNANGSVYATVY